MLKPGLEYASYDTRQISLPCSPSKNVWSSSAFAASERERPKACGALMSTTEADLLLLLFYLNKAWFLNKETHLNKMLDSVVFSYGDSNTKMQWAELFGILLQLVNTVSFLFSL